MVSTALNSVFVLFAIINPIGSIPIFLQLTKDMKSDQRLHTFRVAVIVSALILIIFIFLGEGLLTRFFQISVYDLMAAGGLLLLIIAIDHLIFGSLARGVLHRQNYQPRQIGAVPIACPILAGPGAMMTVLLTASEHGIFVALLSVFLVIGITGLILRYIDALYRVLGKTVCMVLSKVLCLFIAAIGIRLLMRGLIFYLKGV